MMRIFLMCSTNIWRLIHMQENRSQRLPAFRDSWRFRGASRKNKKIKLNFEKHRKNSQKLIKCETKSTFPKKKLQYFSKIFKTQKNNCWIFDEREARKIPRNTALPMFNKHLLKLFTRSLVLCTLQVVTEIVIQKFVKQYLGPGQSKGLRNVRLISINFSSIMKKHTKVYLNIY